MSHCLEKISLQHECINPSMWVSAFCGPARPSWAAVWPSLKPRNIITPVWPYLPKQQRCLLIQRTKRKKNSCEQSKHGLKSVCQMSHNMWRCSWLWIKTFKTFNIFFLWLPLLFLMLSLLRVNSFPVAACWWSSFKSPHKHRPQTGRREGTSYLTVLLFLWSSTLKMLSLTWLCSGHVLKAQGQNLAAPTHLLQLLKKSPEQLDPERTTSSG